jgi:hypothetical protein
LAVRNVGDFATTQEPIMNRRFDFAQPYYWRMQLLEPFDEDDSQYVMLYGEEGETVGPLTMALAEAWIDHFGVVRKWRVDRAGGHGIDGSNEFG